MFNQKSFGAIAFSILTLTGIICQSTLAQEVARAASSEKTKKTVSDTTVEAKISSLQKQVSLELAQTLTESKTLGSFVERLEQKHQLDLQTLKFLKAKIRGFESQPMKVEKVRDLQFQVRAAHDTLLPFDLSQSASGIPGEVIVEINHHVVHGDLLKPAEFWDKLQAVMPKIIGLNRPPTNADSIMNGWWSPIPTAHAEDPRYLKGVIVAMTGQTMPAFVGATVQAQGSYCSRYRTYQQFCGNLTSSSVIKAATYGNSWSSFIRPGCWQEKDQMRECLHNEAVRLNLNVPKNLSAYLRLPSQGADSKPSPTGSTDGGSGTQQ